MKIKRDLEHGHYKEDQATSRSEYVLQLYNQVCLLLEPMSEQVIVRNFSRHFDEQVRLSVLAQGVNTISGLITLLDALDQAGSLNSQYSHSISIRASTKDPFASPRNGTSGRAQGQSQNSYSGNYTRRDSSPHGFTNRFKSNNEPAHPSKKVNFISEVSDKMCVDSESENEQGN